MLAGWTTNDKQPLVPRSDPTLIEPAARFMHFAPDYYYPPSKEVTRFWDVVKHLDGLYGWTTVGELGPLRFKSIRQRFIDGSMAAAGSVRDAYLGYTLRSGHIAERGTTEWRRPTGEGVSLFGGGVCAFFDLVVSSMTRRRTPPVRV